MSQELLYTSAPAGLKPGSRGFCTVQSTPSMPVNLADKLESLSGYKHVFAPHDEQAALNPVNWSHLKLIVGGRPLHVLSRVAAAGLDYTQRTNKLAHHVALDISELPACGPAALLAAPGFMKSQWNGDVKQVAPNRSVPAVNSRAEVCHHWQTATGDAGWGGVLAQSARDRNAAGAVIVYSPGTDILPLLVESLALLPPEQRWQVTFSTYYTKLPPGVDCLWRCVLANTPEALSARRSPATLVIDLTTEQAGPAEGPLVEAARTGRVAESPTPPAIKPPPLTSPVTTDEEPLDPYVNDPFAEYEEPSQHPPALAPATSTAGYRLSRASIADAEPYSELEEEEPPRRRKRLIPVAAGIVIAASLMAFGVVAYQWVWPRFLIGERPVTVVAQTAVTDDAAPQSRPTDVVAPGQPADTSTSSTTPLPAETPVVASDTQSQDGSLGSEGSSALGRPALSDANDSTEDPKTSSAPSEALPSKVDLATLLPSYVDIIGTRDRDILIVRNDKLPELKNCELKLLGGTKELLNGINIECDARERTDDKGWGIRLRQSNNLTYADAASILLTKHEMYFHWQNAGNSDIDGQLANCGMLIQKAGKQHYLQFRKPDSSVSFQIVPHSATHELERVEATMQIDYPPDLASLRVDLFADGVAMKRIGTAIGLQTSLFEFTVESRKKREHAKKERDVVFVKCEVTKKTISTGKAANIAIALTFLVSDAILDEFDEVKLFSDERYQELVQMIPDTERRKTKADADLDQVKRLVFSLSAVGGDDYAKAIENETKLTKRVAELDELLSTSRADRKRYNHVRSVKQLTAVPVEGRRYAVPDLHVISTWLDLLTSRNIADKSNDVRKALESLRALNSHTVKCDIRIYRQVDEMHQVTFVDTRQQK